MASHLYFLARFSESAAGRLCDSYEAALGALAENPHSYPKYESQSNFATELYTKLFAKRYRIVFEVIDKTVFVYDIQDCRQDIDKRLI